MKRSRLGSGLLFVFMFLFFNSPARNRPRPYLELALQAENWINRASIPLTVGKTWHPHPGLSLVTPKNLDFEESSSESPARGWRVYKKNQLIQLDTRIFHKGKKSIRITSDDDKAYAGVYQIQNLGLKQNKKLIVSLHVRKKNFTGTLYLGIYTASGSEAISEISKKEPVYQKLGWEKYEAEIFMPKETTFLNFGFWLKGRGKVWLDDFHFSSTDSDRSPGEKIRPDFSDLYSGTPGVILFYLELYQVTRDKGFLGKAESGADYLLDLLMSKKSNDGLYAGVGGHLYLLERIYYLTGGKKYRDGILKCLDYIKTKEVKGKNIIKYRDPEIISGGSGDGLALLRVAKNLKLKQAKTLAVKIANGILASSLKENKEMPNFSHGVAGVGYFLASLYEATRDKKYLARAMELAGYLGSISEENCLIYHDTRRRDLFYLGWCHGPAGTARFYYKIWKITGEKKWLERIYTSADAVIKSGIPQKLTPGFWNNLGVCCGNAGVAEFFLSLYKISGNKKYLDFCYLLTRDIISKGTKTSEGIKWMNAEYNRDRGYLVAQTGLMQGAAGIGLWLLHLDGFENRTHPLITLPDNPFDF